MDMLRIDGTESFDEVGGGNTYSHSASFTLFMTPNAKVPVARNVQSTAVFNGLASNPVLRFFHLDAVSLGGPVHAREGPGLRCWPNPASSLVYVMPPETGEWTFRIVAPEGRVLRETTVQVRSGSPVALDLELSPGTYTLRASDADARGWWRTVVVAP
jgi:hypothetical protein